MAWQGFVVSFGRRLAVTAPLVPLCFVNSMSLLEQKPDAAAAKASECPVHSRPSSPQAAAAAEAGAADGCPVKDYKAPVQYDVYGRPIKLDPRNNMPVVASQSRAPQQAGDLSTERVASNIPKAGADETWRYPSPQMFWNALVRKGKADGAKEEDMETVVAVHNNMNELAWKRVLEWEKLRDRREEGKYEPRLSRFTGRPDELSLKARLKVLFGHPPPFDRHAWIVDRGGKEVRYIIDYYSDESKADADTTPSLMSPNAVKSIKLDVRPASDSLQAFIDRCYHMDRLVYNQKVSKPLPFFAPPAMREAYTPAPPKKAATAENTTTTTTTTEDEEMKSASAAYESAASFRSPAYAPSTGEPRETLKSAIASKCGERFIALRDCGDDERKCADAAIVLQHCVASLVCPKEAEDFRQAATTNDKPQADASYAKMDKCLERFAADAEKQQLPAAAS